MDTASIRNIIFDLGGVILNIDYKKLERNFRDIGIYNFERLYSQAIQFDIFDKFEKGLISTVIFRNELRRFIPTEISDAQIDQLWSSVLLDIPVRRIRLLEKLRQSYKIFLLSNTDEIHYKIYNHDFQERYGYKDLSELFDKAYYSFQLGMKKPSREIFQLVIAENDLEPSVTLFIDDAQQNIQAARQEGFLTLLLPDDMDIIEVFDPETLRVCQPVGVPIPRKSIDF